MKIETLAVHTGREIEPATGAVTPSITLATTFERDADAVALPDALGGQECHGARHVIGVGNGTDAIGRDKGASRASGTGAAVTSPPSIATATANASRAALTGAAPARGGRRSNAGGQR